MSGRDYGFWCFMLGAFVTLSIARAAHREWLGTVAAGTWALVCAGQVWARASRVSRSAR